MNFLHFIWLLFTLQKHWVFKATRTRQKFKNEEIAALIALLRLSVEPPKPHLDHTQGRDHTQEDRHPDGSYTQGEKVIWIVKVSWKRNTRGKANRQNHFPTRLLESHQWTVRTSQLASEQIHTAQPEPTNECSPSRVSVQHLVGTYPKATTKPGGWRSADWINMCGARVLPSWTVGKNVLFSMDEKKRFRFQIQ